ncbi:MAG: TlpA family protein disulfide reductase [Cytophagia bacterium]|nr:MAG: TlpA family protein disulfide reductase [Cytophagia bacterium]
MKKKTILFIVFILCYNFTIAQNKQKQIEEIINKTENNYLKIKNCSIKYDFYQKEMSKSDTLVYNVDLKHHKQTGKLFYKVERVDVPLDHCKKIKLYELKKKNDKNLYNLFKTPTNDMAYGTLRAKEAGAGRQYKHLPHVNTQSFFKKIRKNIKEITQNKSHYIISCKNYTLYVNIETFWIEKLIYNNEEKELDNIYELIVFKQAEYNLDALENLSVYNIPLPKIYNRFINENLTLKDTLAPHWELPNILNDEMVKLSDFKNKIVVIDFWNTSCPPCVAFLPSLKKLQKEFESKEVVFIGIALDKSKENIVKHLKRFAGGVFYTNVICDDDLVLLYKIMNGFPAFFVLDKNHKIVYSQEGTRNAYKNLKNNILMALKK